MKMGTVIGKLDRKYNDIAVGDTVGIEVDGGTVTYTVDSFGGLVKEDGTRLAPKEWKGEAFEILAESPVVIPKEISEVPEDAPAVPEEAPAVPEETHGESVSDMEDEVRRAVDEQNEERLLAMKNALEDFRREVAGLRKAQECLVAAQVYRVGDWELVPVADARKITVAQYVDFQTFCTEPEHIVELLSVLMVPRGCAYNQGYDVAEVQAAIREGMSVEEVLRVSAFFLRRFAGLIQDSLSFSEREAERMPEPARTETRERLMKVRAMWRRLTGSGDGSPTSTRSAGRAGAAGRRSGR